MDLSSLLGNIAKKLKFHNSREQTFIEICMSMIDQNSVQHHALTKMMQSEFPIKSKLERIRRFLKSQDIDQIIFAKALIAGVWGDNIPKMHLMMDRTNWKFGKQNINYLVLAARVGKITFPLFWNMLDHQGNSDSTMRIELLNKFKQAFGLNKILSFSADREFIGKDWWCYLLDNNIPFFIRIKCNQSANFGSHKLAVKDFFSHLKTDESRYLHDVFDDTRLFIVGKRIKNEYLIICSNIQNKELVLKTYQQRWDIERLFRNMKTQGFNLENTHMQDLNRLSKLMCIVTIVILWTSIVGLTQSCQFKKTVSSSLYSLFTMGLRWLKNRLLIFDFTTILQSLQKSEG
jgi:hypothetical protein